MMRANMKNFRTTPHRSLVDAVSLARRVALSMPRGPVTGLVAGLVACLSLLWPALAQAVEGRHALIIGISHYAPNVGADTLEGVPYDMKSARQMAIAMGVDDKSIIELRDEQATKRNIEAQLARLTRRVQQGDRVFVYFSGHGTRMATGGGCEEGLLSFDGDMINEQEFAKYTGPMSQRAEKMITMVDSCFSGGVLTTTRALSSPAMRPKFISKANQDACSTQGSNNLVTRSLLSELGRFGIKSENFVQIAAAKRDEVSWDEPGRGGMATQAISRCLLGEASDLNRSGAVSLDEVRACAQQIMDQRMAPSRSRGLLPSTIQVSGNRNLVVTPSAPPAPVVVQAPPPAPVIVQAPPAAVMAAPPTATPVASPALPATQVEPVKLPGPAPSVVAVAPTPAPTPAPTLAAPAAPPAAPLAAPAAPVAAPVAAPAAPAAAPEPMGSLATLQELFQQRDSRRELLVSIPSPNLRIGQDKLSLSVKSPVAGYVYVVMLGSDEKSFYLLFPNKVDGDNRIKANQTLLLPRPSWEVTAGGPAGTNRMLVVVSQSPRDPKVFVPTDGGGGAFTFAVADLVGRNRLMDFFLGKGVKGRSATMSAALVDIKEIP
jgi:hypothetical protein